MKITKWLGLIAVTVGPLFSSPAQTPAETPPPAPTQTPAEAPPPAPAQVPTLSAGAAEVVRLAGANTSEDVVLGYIQTATTSFELNADQILYLRDIGVSSPVITAMLNRDNALRGQPPSASPTSVPSPAPAPTPASVPPAQEPPPEPASTQAQTAPLTPPPAYVSNPSPEVSYFYDGLSPYGTWVQLDGVGWCWQPRAVIINHSWRPYSDSGHWVYTDAGWFWQSDYSWGWAAFHYGRWHLHERCGWVWLPDRVWGPAWVTWRSQGDHCGWAPLPPHADFDVRFGLRFNGVHVGANFDFGLRPDHFTFIAMRDFHEHDFAHHRLPRTEVTRIYNHTTIINNYVVNNRTVVNEGIKVDRVAAATHTQVHKVAIRDVPAGAASTPGVRGGAKADLVVYRPELKAPARPVNMVAQKVDDRHPVIQHAPVVPVNPRRPLVAETSSNGGRGPQGQNPGNGQTSPRGSYRPGNPTAPSAPSALPANRAESAKPAPNANVPSRPATPPGSGKQSYPLRSGPGSTEATRGTEGQTPKQYYPKGHYQAPETRPAPSANNARPADPRSQPAVNSRGQGNSNRNPSGNGPSRKNEQ